MKRLRLVITQKPEPDWPPAVDCDICGEKAELPKFGEVGYSLSEADAGKTVVIEKAIK